MTKEVKKIWEELSNIPVDNEDLIETNFLHFEAGTPKFDVWHWIEDKHNVSIADLHLKA